MPIRRPAMSVHPQRIGSLDGLRAVAVLIVMSAHLITNMVPGGFGVTVFFFISGFVITRLLIQRPDDPLSSFYIRRAFRILPALFVYIGISSVIVLMLHGQVFPSDILATLFYYANYHDFHSLPLKVTWSLSVEEHFYLVFPLLLFGLRNRLDKLQSILIAILVAALAWRCVMSLYFHASDIRITAGTDTRIDSIGYGCLFSVIAERARTEARWSRLMDNLRRPVWAGVAALLLLVSLLIRNDQFRETLRYSIQGAAFFPIFAALFFSSSTLPAVDRVLSSIPARWIGLFSYSLYLWHSLGWHIAILCNLRPLPLAIFGFGFAFGAAALSYFLVEKPCIALGARIATRAVRRPNLPMNAPS
jgi:peptidoglycan/LPS O-acetylase OafA/YrhL